MSGKRSIINALKEMRAAVSKKGAYGLSSWDIRDAKPIGPVIRNSSSVTYFASIDDKGVIRHDSNQACHASLSGYAGSKYIISRLQWGNKWDEKIAPKQVVIDFLEWLTKKSPYAEVFLYGGGERTFRRGFLIAQTEVPANLLAGAMFAHRAVTEHKSYIMKNWYEMYKRGVNPAVAFCYAHGFSNGAQGLFIHTPISADWHISIPTYASEAFIKNFRDGVKVNPNQIYKKNAAYYPVHSLWGKTGVRGGGPRHLDDLITSIHKDLTKKKLSSGPVNPFASGERMKNVVDAGEFFDILSPILIKEFGE